MRKPIPGYELFYWIDEYGNIGSFERIVLKNTGRVSVYSPKSMKFHFNKDGYFMVKLRDDKKTQKGYLVHRLVGLAFLPNPEKLPEINHKDFNRSNNHVSNLEWCTRIHNVRHQKKKLKSKQ